MAAISLHPSSVLSFSLLKDKSVKVVLNVTNTTSNKVAFKIKTTQPTWYYVRPNQQILDANQSEDVIIQLISSEANRLLELNENERENILANHRFLIQSKIISNEIFQRIEQLPLNSRNEEFQRVWENTNKDSVKNQKLKVAIDISEFHSTDDSILNSSSSNKTISENVESIKSKLAQYEEEVIPLSQRKEIVNNFQTLQKKYNAVIEFVVKLTAERDEYLSKYEILRKEYANLTAMKESKDRVLDILDQSQQGRRKYRNDNPPVVQTGFSFLTLVIIGAVSFMLTRYIQIKYFSMREEE